MKTTKQNLKNSVYYLIVGLFFLVNLQSANARLGYIKKATIAQPATISLKIRVYLEGALMNSTGTASDGRPLMRDNLRVSPFDGKRYIPMQDPYQFPIENGPGLTYDLSATTALIERYKEVGCGQYPEFRVIPDASIFDVTGQDAIVDWIFVELRDKDDNTKVIASRSGLLQRDGDIVDLDGVSPLAFPDVAANPYYIALKHRNHLSVMSKSSLPSSVYTTLVNFTSASFLTYDMGIINGKDYRGLGQKTPFKVVYAAMWAGDFNSDGILKTSSSSDDLNILVNDVLVLSERETYGLNYYNAIGYLPSDYDMNSKSKYDNPNDDKNALLGQILFYPINANLLINFDGIVEQMP